MGVVMTKSPLQARTKEELLAGLAKTKEESKTQNHNFLQFSGREGRYVVANGTEDPDPFPNNSKLYLNLFETKKGYVCWKDGKVVDTNDNYSLFDSLPPEAELEDHGPYSTDPNKREGWKMQYSVFMKNVEDGKQYILKLSSPSATRAFGQLIQDVLEQAAMHDFTTQTPIITMGVEGFKSQGHKNYKPRFEISSWEDNPAPAAAIAATGAADKIEDAAPAPLAIPSSRKKG